MNMKRIVLITALVLTLVLCFSITASAEDMNPMQDTGVTITGQLEFNERISYDLTLAKSATVSYEFTCTEGKAGITIAPKDGSKPGMMSDTYIKEGETVEKTRELDSGVYTVTIVNDATSRGTVSSYGYRINVKSSKETYSMGGNSIPQASGPIKFNKEIIGHHAYNDPEDIYRVVIKKAGRISVRVIPSPSTSGIIFMDGQGNEIPTYVSETEDEEGFTYGIDLTPGTYYLKCTQSSPGKYSAVHPYKYEAYGEYKFKVSFKNAKETYTYSNNSIAEVKGKKIEAVPLTKTIKGQLASNDEYDYYKVYIPKTGDYNITIKEDSNYFSHGHPFSFNSLMKKDGTVIRADLESTDNPDPPQVTYFYRGLKKGTYYMQFFEDDYYSKKTGPYSFIIKPAPVTVYTNVASGKKSFTVKWEAGTGHGYQIQYALNKKFTKSKKSVYSTSKPNNSNSVSKKIKKLKAKKTYYIRVRSYVKYNGKKYFSDWSDVVKVKTK